MLDAPEHKVGDIEEVTHDSIVQKEIMEVGEGFKTPNRNAVATITYKAYFFDHTEIESSKVPIKLSLGDIAWPEGLWKGIERMRINETAKIRIKKKKYGFGRKQQVDKLRFPIGYEVEGEPRTRLMKKGIIYEVKLIGWEDRTDIEADGNFVKTLVTVPDKKEWEKPTDRDELVFNLTASLVSQDPSLLLGEERESQLKNIEVFKRDGWTTHMQDPEITLSLRKILETMKRGEKSETLVKLPFLQENDPDVWSIILDKTGDSSAPEGFLFVEIELLSLVKVEEWFKDEPGTGLKRVIKKGKGAHPNIDSLVQLLLKITVNDQVVLNNFPISVVNFEDMKALTLSEETEGLYNFYLDAYNLPCAMIKVLKSMKKGEVVEFETTNIDKLRSNFPNSYFD